jgi:perosamine synthetase
MSVKIPYGRQTIGDDDVAAVVAALKSDWLTQGPAVEKFEKALADYCGAKYAVAYANGTAALQGAYFAAGIENGDEVVTTPITFAATATAAVWQGAKIVFADIDPANGNLDPKAAEAAITKKTKVLAPVDYSGRPVDVDAFRALAKKRGLLLVSDACHSLGATYKGKKVGALADMSVFSFHPVKSITTAEGGAVLTNDAALRDKLARFRTHGISRGEDWLYSVEDQGINSRLTDIQSALGVTQLKKLDSFVARRRALARRYDAAFKKCPYLTPPQPSDESAYHLYVVSLRGPLAGRRKEIFRALREAGIGTQVHYIPVYWHPFYQKLGFKKGLCPKAEAFYENALSLPLYPTLTESQQDEVVAALAKIAETHADRAAR